MKLRNPLIFCFLLPACFILYGCVQSAETLSQQNPCLPEFKDALEQLEFDQNPALLQKIRQSASLGSAVAQNCLAELCLNGWSVEEDEEKSWKLLQQAAQNGSAAAMYRIGTMYELAMYVNKDYISAMLWYLRSAVRGYADAQTAAGILYEDGLGGPRDITAALFWYRKAASQGEPFAVEALQRLDSYLNDT